MSAAEIVQLLDGFGLAPDAAESLAAKLHEYAQRMTDEQLATAEPSCGLIGDSAPALQVSGLIGHNTFAPQPTVIGAVSFGGED